MLSLVRASTPNTARQVSAMDGVPAVEIAPSSRTARMRRLFRTCAVVSEDAVNTPTMLPSASRIGLCEKVK
jgi:hypothetical protein